MNAFVRVKRRTNSHPPLQHHNHRSVILCTDFEVYDAAMCFQSSLQITNIGRDCSFCIGFLTRLLVTIQFPSHRHLRMPSPRIQLSPGCRDSPLRCVESVGHQVVGSYVVNSAVWHPRAKSASSARDNALFTRDVVHALAQCA